jgi:hypothetical protein
LVADVHEKALPEERAIARRRWFCAYFRKIRGRPHGGPAGAKRQIEQVDTPYDLDHEKRLSIGGQHDGDARRRDRLGGGSLLSSEGIKWTVRCLSAVLNDEIEPWVFIIP